MGGLIDPKLNRGLPLRIFRLAFLFLMVIAIRSPRGFALSPDEQRVFLEKMATPLNEDKIFYRWQSRASGDTLIRSGSLDQKLFDYYMRMTGSSSDFAAGRGVYISENAHSSSQFVRGEDSGSIIEVRLAKGTKTLDLTNDRVKTALEQAGMQASDVYSLNPKVAVKYDGSNQWWVVKQPEGVTFAPFEGAHLTPEELFTDYKRLNGPKAKDIYRVAVVKTAKDIVKARPELGRDPSNHELLGAESQRSILREWIESIHDRAGARALGEYMAKPGGRQLIFTNELGTEALRAEHKYSSIQDLVERYPNQIDQKYLRDGIKAKFGAVSGGGEYLKLLNEFRDATQSLPFSHRLWMGDSYAPHDHGNLTADEKAEASKILAQLAPRREEMTDYLSKLTGVEADQISKVGQLRGHLYLTGDPHGVGPIVANDFSTRKEARAALSKIGDPANPDAAASIRKYAGFLNGSELAELIEKAHLPPTEKVGLMFEYFDRLSSASNPHLFERLMVENATTPALKLRLLDTAAQNSSVSKFLRMAETLKKDVPTAKLSEIVLKNSPKFLANKPDTYALMELTALVSQEHRAEIVRTVLDSGALTSNHKLSYLKMTGHLTGGGRDLEHMGDLLSSHALRMMAEAPDPSTAVAWVKILGPSHPAVEKIIFNSGLSTRDSLDAVARSIDQLALPGRSDLYLALKPQLSDLLSSQKVTSENLKPVLKALIGSDQYADLVKTACKSLGPSDAVELFTTAYSWASAAQKKILGQMLLSDTERFLKPPFDATNFGKLLATAGDQKMTKEFVSKAAKFVSKKSMSETLLYTNDVATKEALRHAMRSANCVGLISNLKEWVGKPTSP